MATTLADIIGVMETIAPAHLAERWDNPGLQVGHADWPVERIRIALDPLPDVVKAACQADVDLLITHHPLIFEPLHALDFSSTIGSIVHMASRYRLAIFSAHTNLDSVSGGLNDMLAHRMGLTATGPLKKAESPESYKLVFFVPIDYEPVMLAALFGTDAGHIGPYSCCTFRSTGKGTFKPGPAAEPFSGETGTLSHVDEVRIEVVVDKRRIASVISRLRDSHPYETMAYDLYPLVPSEGLHGLGRVAAVKDGPTLADFAERIKQRLAIESVRVVGRPDLTVSRAALCSGSGGGLLAEFLSSDADVYVTGDMRYHDARAIEAAGRGLVDLGHFVSEHLVVEELARLLQNRLDAAGIVACVETAPAEKDPFVRR